MKLAPVASLAAAALFIALLSCGTAQPETSSEEANSTATAYLDLEDFLQLPGQSDSRYQALQTELANDFANLCGDTFCGSDYANLTPLAFNCAVTSKEGKLKSCAYTFGGSFAQTDAKTGKISVTAKTFTCPVAVAGTSSALFDALLATGTTPALQRPLPGSTNSIYDALGGCLP